MGERSIPALTHKAGVLVFGLAATFAAGVAGFFLSYFMSMDCKGSDTSEFPVGTDAAVCQGYREDVVILVGWASATAAPFLGMIWALAVARWTPLWIGCAAAIAVLFAYFLLVPSL